METVKILHCADLHIGAAESFLLQRAYSRRLETLLTFEKTVLTAVNENVKLFLIAGDLFDSDSVDASAVKSVLDCIEKASGTEFVYAAGNHDPLNASSPLVSCKLPDNLHILSTSDDCIYLEALNTKVYGKSFSDVYSTPSRNFSVAPDQNTINIMCIHGDLISDSPYNHISKSFIEQSGMDYIALGHVHKRTDIQVLGKTSYAYCGCIEGQGFDELGEKGVYIGTVSKQGVNLEFLRMCKRQHICESIDITGIADTQSISNKIIEIIKEKYGADFAENLYKAQLTGTVSEDTEIPAEEIEKRIENEVYFIKIKDMTQPQTDYSLLAQEPTIEGLFTKNMLERLEKADGEEKELINDALKIGLKAFFRQVNYVEN